MDKEERIIELLEALLKVQLLPFTENEFKDKKKQKLYELTGKGTVRELEKKLGISRQTISNIWMKWENQGLLRKNGKFYKKIL